MRAPIKLDFVANLAVSYAPALHLYIHMHTCTYMYIPM